MTITLKGGRWNGYRIRERDAELLDPLRIIRIWFGEGQKAEHYAVTITGTEAIPVATNERHPFFIESHELEKP